MISDRHGAQGQMDGASKATLENEFGTNNDEEVIKQILEKGTLQESEVRIFLPTLPPSLPQLVTGDLTLIVSQLGCRETRKQERQHGFPSCPLDMSILIA